MKHDIEQPEKNSLKVKLIKGDIVTEKDSLY